MSINFQNICSKIDRSCGTNSTNYTLANKAIDVNIAQDEVWAEALKNNGWNVDDFNQTDYPIITTNLVTTQRDYTFVKDSSDNFILDIYKVQIMDSAGIYHDIKLVDRQADTANSTMNDGQNTTGIPTTYDLTENGIMLDVIPVTGSVTMAKGLRVFIDREPTYFTSADTTKVSGIDMLCQDYLYLKPSYEYARDKRLPQAEKLFRDLQISMEKTKKRYGTRQKNMPNRMVGMQQDNH